MILRPFAWPYRLKNWIRRLFWHKIGRHFYVKFADSYNAISYIAECPCGCKERWVQPFPYYF